MRDAARRPDDATPEPDSAAKAEPKQDVVVLGPPTADGDGVHVLRAQGERVEAGELRTIKEGKPLVGEIVSLAPRPDNPRVLDVKESWRPPAGAIATTSSAKPRKGPAQVASQAYRDNYDEIFDAKKTLN
jgi:hypothetical protein